jgi:arylformamidase
MIVRVTHNHVHYAVDLNKPLDISLPIRAGDQNPNCYWAEPVTMETIRAENFVGSVAAGGSVNYQKLQLTPHGNGTHTECYGHISADGATVNQCLETFHFFAEVISVAPETHHEDRVITRSALAAKINSTAIEAIVIRTLPNGPGKKTAHYSGTNPPYLLPDAVAYLRDLGVNHLLLDLPSVDRELDEGKLLAHRAFWQFPEATRKNCSITELIFVADTIPDGLYWLNLQIASLEMDASPSKPVLYQLKEVS